MAEESRPPRRDLDGKREEYTAFIETVLEPRFRTAQSFQNETEAEIKEYGELKAGVEAMLLRNGGGRGTTAAAKGKETECLVDLGHGVAYSRAVVEDPRTIFVDVGMGFHVEFTLEEAVRFIDKRTAYLTDDVLAHRAEKAGTVGRHLEDARGIMESLERELEAMDLGLH